MNKEEKQNNLINKIRELIKNEGYEVHTYDYYPDDMMVYDNGEVLLGIEFH